MPSEEPRERNNRPLAGGPQLCVNQFDKIIDKEPAQPKLHKF